MSIFDNIIPEDILFQTEDVCILKPEVKKGVLVYHSYNSKYPNIIQEGLKSNRALLESGLTQVCRVPHKCIFFRAPYHSPFLNKSDIDYTDPVQEIASVYPLSEQKLEKDFFKNKIWIRVDPRHTYIFSSEIRDIFLYPELYQKPHMINNSRKSMLDYFKTLEENHKIIESNPGKHYIYNLYSSKVELRDTYPFHFKLPLNPHSIKKNSEVLVENPHLEPHHFVRI